MIKKVQERALGLILNDHESDFETLLLSNNDVCNHHRNIQTFLIEVIKIKKGCSTLIMDSILKKRNNTYNIRKFQEFETERE